MPKLTFYGHPRSAPTYRVGLALALMQEPFAFEIVDLPNGGGQNPAYKAKSRFGQVPCIQDGSDTIIQSSAILEYLAEKTGKFGGKTALERAHINEWMFWDFDRLCPGLFRSRAYALGFRKGGAGKLHQGQAVACARQADDCRHIGVFRHLLCRGRRVRSFEISGHLGMEKPRRSASRLRQASGCHSFYFTKLTRIFP